jgi:serine/threonine-protein kinase PpkA
VDIEIPNYVLVSKLGSGAMAQVWLAEHRVNKRRAAIKLLQRSLLDDADAEALFLREGEVLAGFRDENIVAIYDNARVGDFAYIAMEYLAGGTLLDRMRRGPISVGESIAFVAQAARALGVAHRAGVIHRDLKPANIMFRDEGTPVLTDFGAARVLERNTIYGKDGGIIGTPTYMSPEQIQGFALDGRSDLYSLGVLFYELLTGEPPYKGSHITEVASQHVLAPVPRLPPAAAMLQPVIDLLLAKKPEERYRDADALVAALRELYLADEDLRRQVGYSASSAAWSSQLRAMGFVLDTDARTEARKAEAAHLERTSAMPPPLPARPTPAPPPTPTPASVPAKAGFIPPPPTPPPAKSGQPVLAVFAVLGLLLFLALAVAGIAYMAKSSPPEASALGGAITIAPAPAPVPPPAAAREAGDASVPADDAPLALDAALDEEDSDPAMGSEPVPACEAECQFFRQLLASAQTGFAQIRGEATSDDSFETGATPGRQWAGCEITGYANSEMFHCASMPEMGGADPAIVFAQTRSALRAAAPGARVLRDEPALFTIGAGNVWAEVQIVPAQYGNPRFVHFGSGRNRAAGPGSMPTH